MHGKNPLSEDTIGTAAIQIINTLEYIHSKGYTHNDVKVRFIFFEALWSVHQYNIARIDGLYLLELSYQFQTLHANSCKNSESVETL